MALPHPARRSVRTWSLSAALLLLHHTSLAQTIAQTAAHPPAPAAAHGSVQPTAQIASQPPLLSPQAAFDQANLPVDITRRDSQNWSDIELAALDVAVAQAKDACLARATEPYTGGDLVAYAHLCAFGKQWLHAQSAATDYLEDKLDPRPQLTEAYSYLIEADLQLGEEKRGFNACLAMLLSVPYDPLADAITSATVRYLQFAYTWDAITVLAERQPFLLKLLRASRAGDAQAATEIPAHTLFEHALALPALEQYDDEQRAATDNLADIDFAMPSTLAPDEAILIAADRRQYALIGTHFPALPGAVSLLPAAQSPPAQPKYGSVTIFLLFPPWCMQCVHQAQEIAPTLARMQRLSGPAGDVRVYALLADTPAPTPAQPKSSARPATHVIDKKLSPNPAAKPTVSVTLGPSELPNAQDTLRTTPTLVVAPSTLADFNASDFPFLIAVDHDGIIRLMAAASPDNALQQDGPADQIAGFILDRWPLPPRAP